LEHNEEIKRPPATWREKLKWLGPGITWMAAGAGGAGELLFPPRVGSLYGYAFLWALLLAVLLKWFINREIGRYAVSTGRSLLEGYKNLPGPRHWAVWIIIVPQLFVAVGSVAGIAGSAATAFILLLPGSVELWTAFTLVSAVTLLSTGSYKIIEKVAMVFALLLGIVGIGTALYVFPDTNKFVEGLRPSIPADVDYVEIIPWLSFVLAGAAGMTWYSYWVPAKGYGAANVKEVEKSWTNKDNIARLKGWISEMTLDNTLGVIGGLLIVLSFLILGTELLRPQQLVPEEDKVAAVLGKLLENSFGRVGFWAMIVGVLVGFWNTAMTNQDGWARLFADGINILLEKKRISKKWRDENYLRKWIQWIVLAAVPLGVFLLVGEPVGLLQVAGVIEAIHIPIIAALTLYMNAKTLPRELRPSTIAILVNIVACLFFIGFAILYLLNLGK
jgi:Mn2+/Fe2+ NRAMP family transporter